MWWPAGPQQVSRDSTKNFTMSLQCSVRRLSTKHTFSTLKMISFVIISQIVTASPKSPSISSNFVFFRLTASTVYYGSVAFL